jgi:hypothetical protein
MQSLASRTPEGTPRDERSSRARDARHRAGWLSQLLTVVLLGVAPATPVQGQGPTSQECGRHELLVKFRPGADPATVTARHGATVRRVIPGIEVYLLAVPGGSADDAVATFSADPDVAFAEINGTMTVPERPPVDVAP